MVINVILILLETGAFRWDCNQGHRRERNEELRTSSEVIHEVIGM